MNRYYTIMIRSITHIAGSSYDFGITQLDRISCDVVHGHTEIDTIKECFCEFAQYEKGERFPALGRPPYLISLRPMQVLD